MKIIIIICYLLSTIFLNALEQETIFEITDEHNFTSWIINYKIDHSTFLDPLKLKTGKQLTLCNSGRNKIILTEINKNGTLKFLQEYKKNRYDYTNKLILDKNNNLIFIGGRYTGWLVEVDIHGNMIFEKEYDSFSSAISIIEIASGGYIILGEKYKSEYKNSLYLMKIDSKKNIIWEKEIDNDENLKASNLFKINNEIFLTALIAPQGQPSGRRVNSDAILINKLDMNGNLLKTKILLGSQVVPYNIVSVSFSDYIFILTLFYDLDNGKTNPILYKIDSDLEFIASKRLNYNLSESVCAPHAIKILIHNSSLLLVLGDGSSFILSSLSKELNSEWNTIVKCTDFEEHSLNYLSYFSQEQLLMSIKLHSYDDNGYSVYKNYAFNLDQNGLFPDNKFIKTEKIDFEIIDFSYEDILKTLK